MSDKRSHRGPNPRDRELFAAEQLASLRSAVADYSLLLSMGYPESASLKLVGDHHDLKQRQRMAIARSSCTADQASARKAKGITLDQVGARTLEVDGFNLLITVESALSGGFIIIGRDSAYRDIASLHGTFRTVEETVPALELIGRSLQRIARVRWLLDRPVSNSGKVRQLIEDVAGAQGWDWQVELVQDPDAELKRTANPIVTADSVILDHCQSWVNLSKAIIRESIPGAEVVDLGAYTSS